MISTLAIIVFGVALAFILLLFTLKMVEVRRGARFAEGLRTHADTGALWLKSLLADGEYYLGQTPWFIGMLVRYGIHVGALSFARLARASGEYAHRLADLVSHKHRFERKETKSQYLKFVADRPAPPPVPQPEAPAPTPEYAVEPKPAPRPMPTFEPAPQPKRKKRGRDRANGDKTKGQV